MRSVMTVIRLRRLSFWGIPKRTVRWSRALVRKFGVVIARALTVRGARIERGKIHDPVTVGELVWCLPSEVDSDVYLMLLAPGWVCESDFSGCFGGVDWAVEYWCFAVCV